MGAVDHNGTELIAVVLHSDQNQRFGDTAKLWDYTLKNCYETTVLHPQDNVVEMVRVKRGAVRNVEAATLEEAAVTVPNGESTDAVRVEISKDAITAPVKKGDKVGVLKVYNGEKLMDQTELYAVSDVEEGGFLSIFGVPDDLAILVYGIVIVLILIGIVLVCMHLQARKTQEQQEERMEKDV